MDVLVVTGMSGAGKSSALRALEDLGFVCVDNLPLGMLKELVATTADSAPGTRLAVGLHCRPGVRFDKFEDLSADLVHSGHSVEVLFLDAPDPTLTRRYSETRRRHPMGELPEALARDREALASIRALASAVIDTENLKARDLGAVIKERYGEEGAMTCQLTSFGFKNGIPPQADLVLDARFLQNPYDDVSLRPLSGKSQPVREFVLGQADAATLLEMWEALLRFQVPRSLREGRSYLNVAIGCTGGQHRSVALVEALHQRLRAGATLSDPPTTVKAGHRDVDTSHDPA